MSSPYEKALLERWQPLAKGRPMLYLEYGRGGGRCYQWCDGIEARATKPIELRLDLSTNLRARNKATNQYVDARELADGAIERLELLQIDDRKVIDRLKGVMRHAEQPDPPWTLIVELKGSHQFPIEPEAPTDWEGRLYLWVLEGGERRSEWGQKRS